jgi:Uma2 family endonuclease
MATEISKRLFTVEDYYRMADAGILLPKDRVELIRGEVIAMSPIGRLHGAAVVRASNALFALVRGHALVSVQGAVRLDQYNEPQPDIVLLRLKDDFYASGHAGPNDILLIIEVADSSFPYDRNIKGPLYAETGVVEYWIADIQNDCVWAYSDIQDNAYGVTRQFRRGDSIEPKLLTGCPIPVDVLLP